MQEKRYQDFVIKDGKFIGNFEEMYQEFDNPWCQSDDESIFDSRRAIAKGWIKRISGSTQARVCEVGCGFGHLTGDLTREGVSCIGTDISATAVKKAKEINPGCRFSVTNFDDFQFYRKNKINIFLMSELTWYVLPKLAEFLSNLRHYQMETDEPIYLIHLLTTYSAGLQKYGNEYFTDLESILDYFDLKYLEYGYIVGGGDFKSETRGTFFVARI